MFQKYSKNVRNFFSFLDNCIWIGSVNLSHLRTGYFSSAANVLTSSPKIFHLNKRELFKLNFPERVPLIWSMCCDVDFKSAWAGLPCCLSKNSLKRDILDIYLTTFSQSIISEIQNLRRLSFFPKYLKFNLNFKNAAKNWETVSCFLDNCIWIGFVKLSLLRTGTFWSVANVLTGSPKSWYVNKRDFFKHNFFTSDKWMW